MTVTREHTLGLAGTTVPLPCFFPSVSSVKTNLLPVDYVELLAAAAHPLYLVSAYDIANSCPEHQQRIRCAIGQSRTKGSAILLDSGNYEGFWKGSVDWNADGFHAVSSAYEHDIGFCYDNQAPPQYTRRDLRRCGQRCPARPRALSRYNSSHRARPHRSIASRCAEGRRAALPCSLGSP